MRKVSNRKTLRHLSMNLLKQGKSKNIAAIVAIILTTVMFTALFSIGMSLIKTGQNNTMRQVGGSSMAGVKYAQSSDYETLKKDAAIKDISYRIMVGSLANRSLKDMVVEVSYAQDENAKDMFCYPTTGRMPKEKGEIAMSELALKQLGIKAKLGQSVPVELQVKDGTIKKEFTLVGYWKGDVIASAQESFLSKQDQESLAPEPRQSYYESEKNFIDGYMSIDFNFYSSFDIEKQVKNLLKRNGYDTNVYQYGVNWAYATSEVDGTSMAFVIAILFLIMLAGYLIIYNVFYISVVSDIHQYGLLKTIGTTARQLRYVIRRQAMILSLIGIPFGLLLGTFVSKGMLPLLIAQSNMRIDDMVFSVHPLIYVLSIVFVLVTVLNGCRKPGKMAGKVSPVEAVKYEEISTNQSKKHKKTKKVSVFSLARNNCKRERKKVFVVVLSLSLSILLVNGIDSAIKGFDADKYVSASIIGDINISDAAFHNVGKIVTENTVVPESFIDTIKDRKDVKKVANVYCSEFGKLKLGEKQISQISDWIKHAADETIIEELNEDKEKKYLPMDYYGVDLDILKEVDIKAGKLDKDKWATGEYAIIYTYQLADPNAKDPYADMYEIGDSIELETAPGHKTTYRIMAIGEIPYALSTKSYYSAGCSIMVPAKTFLEKESVKGALVSVVTLRDSQNMESYDSMKQLVHQTDSLVITSKKTYLDEFHNFIQSVKVIGGALAMILALIGIMNFANTFITGIMRRLRELAIMQAVGLTRMQMVQMLMLEGLIQGVLTILVSVILHCVIGGPVIHMLVHEIWFYKYQFTITPILLCAPIVLAVAVVIPLIISRTIDKMSVVERMRVE